MSKLSKALGIGYNNFPRSMFTALDRDAVEDIFTMLVPPEPREVYWSNKTIRPDANGDGRIRVYSGVVPGHDSHTVTWLDNVADVWGAQGYWLDSQRTYLAVMLRWRASPVPPGHSWPRSFRGGSGIWYFRRDMFGWQRVNRGQDPVLNDVLKSATVVQIFKDGRR